MEKKEKELLDKIFENHPAIKVVGVDLQVGKTEWDIWNEAIDACRNICEVNSDKLLRLIFDEQNILSNETLERIEADAQLSRALGNKMRELKKS